MVAEVLTKEAPLRWHEHEAPGPFPGKDQCRFENYSEFHERICRVI